MPSLESVDGSRSANYTQYIFGRSPQNGCAGMDNNRALYQYGMLSHRLDDAFVIFLLNEPQFFEGFLASAQQAG